MGTFPRCRAQTSWDPSADLSCCDEFQSPASTCSPGHDSPGGSAASHTSLPLLANPHLFAIQFPIQFSNCGPGLALESGATTPQNLPGQMQPLPAASPSPSSSAKSNFLALPLSSGGSSAGLPGSHTHGFPALTVWCPSVQLRCLLDLHTGASLKLVHLGSLTEQEPVGPAAPPPPSAQLDPKPQPLLQAALPLHLDKSGLGSS